ncbi:MAG: DUF3105 domain-containing protein [Actinomycetota bacterium]|nr:DUF3105 domain-containing protein [Actinomycetota bacterium]
MLGQVRVVDRATPVLRLLLGLALLAIMATGCSGSDGPAACGPITQEALDPNFLLHVLPGARGVRYRTDPPTSGAHQPAPRLARVQHRPLPRPVQVGVLEAGDVLLQYRGLRSSDIDRLERLAGGHVVVAPDPDLPLRFRVVATGWVYKRTCTALDTGALREFVGQRAGKGPNSGQGNG